MGERAPVLGREVCLGRRLGRDQETVGEDGLDSAELTNLSPQLYDLVIMALHHGMDDDAFIDQGADDTGGR